MRGTAFAIAGAILLAGCGGSTSPPLAPIERNELHGFVDRARSAARAGDLAATEGAIESLRARVRQLRGAGRIDDEAADRLLKYSAITRLRARQTLAPRAAEPAAGSED